MHYTGTCTLATHPLAYRNVLWKSSNDAANQIRHFHCLQTTLADIATYLFDCCLPTAPQDWAIANCDTTAGAKTTATGTTTLLPLPTLIVICFFAVAVIIVLQQNCCNATSWLSPSSKVFPVAIACCKATATTMLLPLTLHLCTWCCCCCRLFAVVTS